jgi:Zn ribbon nucleic-acid-binding protein
MRVKRLTIVDMTCSKCLVNWTAGMENANSERLECPGCGYMEQIPPLEVGKRDVIEIDEDSMTPGAIE